MFPKIIRFNHLMIEQFIYPVRKFYQFPAHDLLFNKANFRKNHAERNEYAHFKSCSVSFLPASEFLILKEYLKSIKMETAAKTSPIKTVNPFNNELVKSFEMMSDE